MRGPKFNQISRASSGAMSSIFCLAVYDDDVVCLPRSHKEICLRPPLPTYNDPALQYKLIEIVSNEVAHVFPVITLLLDRKVPFVQTSSFRNICLGGGFLLLLALFSFFRPAHLFSGQKLC